MRFAPGLIAGTFLLTMLQAAQSRMTGEVPIAVPSDDSMLLSCSLESTSGKEKQTLEIRFSVSRQTVEVGPDHQTFAAQITDASIAFDVGNSPEESVHFSINRRTGSISVSGTLEVLETGQCELADSHRKA